MGPLLIPAAAALVAGEGINYAQQNSVAKGRGAIAGLNENQQQGYRSQALGQVQNVAKQVAGTSGQNTANINDYLTSFSKALGSQAPQQTPAGTTNAQGVGGANSLPNVPGANARYNSAVNTSNQTVGNYTRNLMNSMAGVGGIQRTAQEQGVAGQTAGANMGVINQQAGITNLGNQVAESDITANPWWQLASKVLTTTGGSLLGAGAGGALGGATGAGAVGVPTAYDMALPGGINGAGSALAAGGTPDASAFLQAILANGGGAAVA
jgi:hypothetical protein